MEHVLKAIPFVWKSSP